MTRQDAATMKTAEAAAWREEFARIDEYAGTVPTQLGRSVLEAQERAWARGVQS